MSTGADGFLDKQRVNPRDILYIVKEERKTALFLKDGRKVQTMIPAKRFLEVMPDSLVSVNKGVLLGKAHIVNIENGVYTMSDGTSYKGRVRTPGAHKRNRDIIVRQGYDTLTSDELKRAFSYMDRLPLPCFVLELVFDSEGKGIDFLFRYVNEQTVALTSQDSVQNIVNHSFYEVIPEADRRGLLIYSEVALNGSSVSRSRMRTDLNQSFRLHCWQPKPYFCACIAVPEDS